ncbi:MAG: STAS domain-containing protein [Anaerolineales bacterium]|nr:STAS domain-containing protein [Anaerolineales bacterium]
MQLHYTQEKQAGLIAVHGSIDALNAGMVTDFGREKIAGGQSRLVLDLSETEFMSSSGLRAILVLLRECRQRGGDLHLAALQPGVEKLLTLAGFTQTLKFFPVVQEALDDFGQ